MIINSIYDKSFQRYGKIVSGLDFSEMMERMDRFPLPDSGTKYLPSVPAFENCPVFGRLQNNEFGGMPVQIGMCWGRNTRLNCLEYHRCSEINLGTSDFILLLAKQEEIEDGVLDTGKVRAFLVPAGVAVEIYATTLHYAPCHTDGHDGFRVAVVLPKGTNTDRPDIEPCIGEDKLLLACNKWLLAHPDAPEAAKGAYIGLAGTNIDIAE